MLFTENRQLNIFLFLMILLTYLAGMFIGIMEVDAAQYASISYEMSENGSWLQVMHRGSDYLDKPPLLFWLSGLFIKLFGFSTFIYKLPSVLFSLIGIYSTYRLALLIERRAVATLSALILAVTQAYFLMNNDVKTDTILTACIIWSVWQLTEYIKEPSIKRAIICGITIGLGMLAKGPIGLIAPALAIIPFLLFSRNLLRYIFKWHWVAMIIVTCIVLLPMCIGLYTQFDAHPEKVTLGRQSISGLRFFFWEQSFGRITGENEWNNHAGYFFLTSNTLWAFLPWTLIFFVAFFRKIIDFIRQGFYIPENKFDMIPLFGFILPFIALSTSKYQLPHYAFITYPFAAILTAEYIFYHWQRPFDSFSIAALKHIQWIIICVLWIAGLLLCLFIFPENNIIPLIIYGILFIVMLYFTLSPFRHFKTIFASIFTAISLNILLNIQIYPELLKYQFTNTIGQYIAEEKFDKDQVFTMNILSYQSLEAYSHVHPILIDTNDSHFKDTKLFNKDHPLILFTNAEGYYKLRKKHYTQILKVGKKYGIQGLTLSFLIPTSRRNVGEDLYLVAAWKP